ncbi:WPP domain-interacting tail-anchored protein 1-like [Rutidosis leptorrhynchoides]|uniref:WPP domain-interacting tail-anchored protein 1-like n=1 Tax=Rutidosis leptorrhynchoides TaxID=125765 RepID=UPI003A995E2F
MISVEKELNDVQVKLQHAEACNEASQEDRNILLCSTIKNMNNVIDDVKRKVAQSVAQYDSVEDKCIPLSESNAVMKKEIRSVTDRVKCLETSLHQMEVANKASAKDINIFMLKQENFFLVKSLKKTDKGSDVKVTQGDKS